VWTLDCCDPTWRPQPVGSSERLLHVSGASRCQSNPHRRRHRVLQGEKLYNDILPQVKTCVKTSHS
jgi:hypothetical protein